MTRYIKQRDKYNCAPVALLNALKWVNEDVTYKSLKQLRKACKCTKPGGGTRSNHFTTALRKDKRLVLSRTVKQPTLKEIDTWVEKGNVVILRYSWWKAGHYKPVNQYVEHHIEGRWIGHYVLISHRLGKYYTTHNQSRFSTEIWSRRKVRHYLGNEGHGKPDAWFLRKL